jgi:hypothetical protein
MNRNSRRSRSSTSRKSLARFAKAPSWCAIEPLENRQMFATFQVTNLLDAGAGSLRAAVAQANSAVGADTIQFAAALSGGTIPLTTGELALNEAVTIDARPLAQNVTINAGGLSRIFNIPNATGDYTFGGLTLTGGKTTSTNSTGVGGAIRSRTAGMVTIDRCTLSNNQTFGDNADGGALSTSGPATITQSTINGNHTWGLRGRGGGIQITGALTLTRSNITNNTTTADTSFGGGIMAGAATTIDQCTVSGNTTEGSTAFGGGILSAGNLTITDSTFSSNRTKAALASGGAISTGGSTTLTLTRATVSGNKADLSTGGAVYANGTVIINQSTITDNDAQNFGEGVVQPNFGSADVPITVTNSIVAGNGDSAADIAPSPGSTLTVNYSVIGAIVFPDAGGNNIQSYDPQLAPLAYNGGPTQTRRPLPGSPAIDAGDPAVAPNTNQFDQRGTPFVRVYDDDGIGGARVDIGATEWQPLRVSTTADVADGNYSFGNLSLREAIGIANTMNDDARVEFSVFGQIILGGTELGITNDMTISGPGADLLTVSGNNASRVFNVSGAGPVSISGMTIRRGAADVGAGIYNGATTLNLDEVTLMENAATAFGGGLASPGGGEINITNSAIINNSAGNEAGGLESQGVSGSPASVTLSNCTMAGNTANGAGFGGAISNVATGGSATLTLRDCTIANNTGANGAGVLNAVNSGDATTSYIGTIFANNGANVVNFGGTVSSLGYNLSTDSTGNLTADGDLPNTADAGLNQLSNYGGPTPTMQLRTSSPAINAGAWIFDLTTDQRGGSRPQGVWMDIGAFEREATPVQVTSMSYQYEIRQAITFNFDSDARVSYGRSSFFIEDVNTGDGFSDIGTFTFNATGTQAVWNVTNELPDGDYRITDGDLELDFFVFAGDANRNRTVNLADFNILASNFGHSPRTFSQGDFNYDGIVNLADFNLLASRFGTSLGAPGAAVAGTAASLLGTSRTIGFGPAAAHDDPLPEMLA